MLTCGWHQCVATKPVSVQAHWILGRIRYYNEISGADFATLSHCSGSCKKHQSLKTLQFICEWYCTFWGSDSAGSWHVMPWHFREVCCLHFWGKPQSPQSVLCLLLLFPACLLTLWLPPVDGGEATFTGLRGIMSQGHKSLMKAVQNSTKFPKQCKTVMCNVYFKLMLTESCAMNTHMRKQLQDLAMNMTFIWNLDQNTSRDRVRNESFRHIATGKNSRRNN
jgi:hypothetical protein